MKKKILLWAGALSICLSVGIFKLSSADGEQQQTWTPISCILSDQDGHVIVGSKCGGPGPGPCTTTTLCQ